MLTRSVVRGGQTQTRFTGHASEGIEMPPHNLQGIRHNGTINDAQLPKKSADRLLEKRFGRLEFSWSGVLFIYFRLYCTTRPLFAEVNMKTQSRHINLQSTIFVR